MSKFGRKQRNTPEGFDYVEPTLTILDNELREKINEPHEGLRKNESQWPVHQINWQKSRYIYDLYYTYHRISKEVYDYCINNKLVDASLIAKWKRPGYERLCSTYTINPRNYKYGTVSICRVPKKFLGNNEEENGGNIVEDVTTGCRGCASGNGGSRNIFGNKYGQYLAAIQIAREERQRLKAIRDAEEAEDDGNDSDNNNNNHDNQESDDDNDGEEEKSKQTTTKKRRHQQQGNEEDDEEKDFSGPVGAKDGSSGKKKGPTVWAMENEEVELSDALFGGDDDDNNNDVVKEAKAAAKMAAKQQQHGVDGHVQKKSRN